MCIRAKNLHASHRLSGKIPGYTPVNMLKGKGSDSTPQRTRLDPK